MQSSTMLLSILFGAVLAVAPAAATGEAAPLFDEIEVTLDNKGALHSSSVCGFSLFYGGPESPQVALIAPASSFVASVHPGETVAVAVPIRGITGSFAVRARATVCHGEETTVEISLRGSESRRTVLRGGSAQLEVEGLAASRNVVVRLKTTAGSGEAAVRWSEARLVARNGSFNVPLIPDERDSEICPPPELPALRPPIEAALIEWDWRMQDGIGTARVPSSYKEAIRKTLTRGDALLCQLQSAGVPLRNEVARWRALWDEWKACAAKEESAIVAWEELWRRVHTLRRRIALSNPLADTGPLLFVKQVPGTFSNQITQYYGRYARPGGGVFVLDAPGQSMRHRSLVVGRLPLGSYQQPEVSYDGKRVLFAFCPVDETPKNWYDHGDHFYHLFEMAGDGSGPRQITDGPSDDFAARYLPSGKIVFISSRGIAFSRCGPWVAPSYNLTIADADGRHPRLISFHETHEWDPAVLHDGRIIYTRWDYVDRSANHYQHLWTVNPDGSNPRAYYGNNTFNPMGTWEARAVPGSHRVMATAAARHAMTAGSIVLVDVKKGVDGLEPLTRLTPDALFPESETSVFPFWRSHVSGPLKPEIPPEQQRWPGHCYRTPYPLSEDFFLAAYSYDSLVGEDEANPANMFGVYLVDRFGNKELLFRDLNICSLWPVPLRPRPRSPDIPAIAKPGETRGGTFFVQNVYEADPPLPPGSIERLRIVEVLPQTRPFENDPPVGFIGAAPGKQVLGTVPVEPDGSAYFRAPAGRPLMFQALDKQGLAVQIMRSVTYLQPGETVSCIGCHEDRTHVPAQRRVGRAITRPPSVITPGPDGSNPLCYPRLVQPVLDRHCVRCHSREEPGGNLILTGEPRGRFTTSYCTLARFVSFAAWRSGPGWPGRNCEPVTLPGFFGAHGSRLTKTLREGHYDVELGKEDLERLATWMDANALFYGTFDPEQQARQKRGERIEPEIGNVLQKKAVQVARQEPPGK